MIVAPEPDKTEICSTSVRRSVSAPVVSLEEKKQFSTAMER